MLPTVAHLLRRFYVHDTDSALACYRDGETVTLRTKVSNFGRAPRRAEVRFTLTPEISLKQKVDVRPGETAAVELAWKPGKFASDYYPFAAELWADGRCLDREENAFVVWNPAVFAAARRCGRTARGSLSAAGRSFSWVARPIGARTLPSRRDSPAAFDRDFRQMRDFGLRWTRCFLPFKTEEDKRISDAVVQLAQKYGAGALPHAEPASYGRRGRAGRGAGHGAGNRGPLSRRPRTGRRHLQRAQFSRR